MITGWKIYWMMRLSSIVGVCVAVCVIFSIIAFVRLILFINSADRVANWDKKSEIPQMIDRRTRMFKAIAAAVLFGTVASFVPSTKEMAAIIVIPRIANSQTVKEIGTSVVDLAKEWIEELHPPKREGSK